MHAFEPIARVSCGSRCGQQKQSREYCTKTPPNSARRCAAFLDETLWQDTASKRVNERREKEWEREREREIRRKEDRGDCRTYRVICDGCDYPQKNLLGLFTSSTCCFGPPEGRMWLNQNFRKLNFLIYTRSLRMFLKSNFGALNLHVLPTI